MQVQLILTAATPKEAQQLYSLTAMISGALAGDDGMIETGASSIDALEAPKAPKGEKKTRGPKKQEKVKTAEPMDSDDDDDDDLLSDAEDAADISLDDDDEDDLEATPKAKATEKTKASKITLEGHIIPAFRDYAKKHDRKAAADILAKYNVKSVRELPTESFEKVLKKLTA